ncbi:energy transducer TonB [Gramella sp. GC03-9]|uniref:Energy transducer TonB n=1 Tax=Christiangramia oceanisediminis TaxID=2920386 RepID=A0A9X2I9U6_9FLAO|nr:energy transducer TonB [Gramella oceanisediminis]MCP9198663.1 energy transducer TonB [Gramella oceanisediminis]
MKPKKNSKADLRRRWVLFLQIGLILVLFLTLQAFNWKSFDDKPPKDPGISMDLIEEETPPLTITAEKTPPPPPKLILDEIEPVPDDSKTPEDVTVPTDLDLENLPEPEHIEEPDAPDEPITHAFIAVEEVPVFPGCEKLEENEARKSCMSSKISDFVNRNFNTRLGEELGLSGTNLVVVKFVVNKEGLVEQIHTRAPHPELEKEARRVIGELPEMKPGKQRGKAVPVSYSIPIRFRVQD